jgi:hypothetical protein
MKLTKDECSLLFSIVYECKFDFVQSSSNTPKGTFEALQQIEVKLEVASRDKRREGRTSQNDFADVIKRLVKKQ